VNSLAKFLLALKYPAAARERIRSRVRTRLKIAPLIKRGIDRAPGPVTASLNLTHLCNLRCEMCGQWRRQDTSRQEVLPLGKLRELIDALAGYRPKFYLWGGEPLLYPEFPGLLSYLREKNQYTVVNTNGVLLAKHAAAMVNLGVDGLDISIDGPPEVHDRIRGVPGTFEKVMTGLRLLRERRRERGTGKPMVKAIATISALNAGRLEETLDLFAASGLVDAVIFNLGWFTTEKIGRATDRIFRERLGCPSSSWKDFVGALGEVDPGKVKSFMETVRARRRPGPPVFFIPDLPPERVEEYYSRPASFLGRKTCFSPWLSIEVRPNGDLTFCPDFPDYVIGNINEEAFADIWNGERARKFRRLLIEKGPFPLCSRCCGLFAYSE
jgi:radical SAM protein with 4Fe4S-binding SPASM domain